MAAEHASTPSILDNETKRGKDQVYDKFPDVRGTYAHGVAGNQIFSDDIASGEFCQGTKDERASLIDKYGLTYQTEFWFYGTKTQGVVFIRSLSLIYSDHLPRCNNFVVSSLEIQRGYVSDGFIHSFVFDSHTLPAIGSYRIGTTAKQYSGSFLQLQSLMARSALPRPHGLSRLSRDTVAGQAVVCSGMSGLVWNSTCYASAGALRGMLLRSQAGDDERIMFNSEVLEVQINVPLPGVVFEVDRNWSLRD